MAPAYRALAAAEQVAEGFFIDSPNPDATTESRLTHLWNARRNTTHGFNNNAEILAEHSGRLPADIVLVPTVYLLDIIDRQTASPGAHTANLRQCLMSPKNMTKPSCIDPLELGQRVMAILHTGRRTATYKLATLSALIDYCEQNAPLDDPCASIDVPIDDLADRVIEMYWRQVEPLDDGRLLHQSSESATILNGGQGASRPCRRAQPPPVPLPEQRQRYGSPKSMKSPVATCEES